MFRWENGAPSKNDYLEVTYDGSSGPITFELEQTGYVWPGGTFTYEFHSALVDIVVEVTAYPDFDMWALNDYMITDTAGRDNRGTFGGQNDGYPVGYEHVEELVTATVAVERSVWIAIGFGCGLWFVNFALRRLLPWWD